jgi:hypothetical protein
MRPDADEVSGLQTHAEERLGEAVWGLATSKDERNPTVRNRRKR